MKLQFAVGDATRPNVSAPYWILHGCNDIGAWGSGFVLALNKTFGTDAGSPVDEYHLWFDEDPKPRLGDIGFAHIDLEKDIRVVNMITQKGCGPVTVGRFGHQIGIPFRYEAFEECLQRVKFYVKQIHGISGVYPNLVSPRIGCGLAMAEWEEVENIIRTVFDDMYITYTVYDLPVKSC